MVCVSIVKIRGFILSMSKQKSLSLATIFQYVNSMKHVLIAD